MSRRAPDASIDTVLFIDGLRRVLQTKKDATLHQAPGQAPRDGRIVSGRIVFDELGRVIAQYYPVAEYGPQAESFNPSFDDEAPPTVTATAATTTASRCSTTASTI